REVWFFLQAEDGIRDSSVTGVQTCARPICRLRQHVVIEDVHDQGTESRQCGRAAARFPEQLVRQQLIEFGDKPAGDFLVFGSKRSEERRVGKAWSNKSALDTSTDTRGYRDP